MATRGDVLGGKYRLVAQLASGGMGTVWRAEHVDLAIPVALKLMLPEIAGTAAAEKRFRREARAAARLRSPHVVQIHDYGVSEGCPYLAMELLEGEDLEKRLARVGPLALADATRILEGVARALELAHENGIIHRDLKPANIFLAQEGNEEVVKVLDFGVAKVETGADARTSTGANLVGSPAYMSPEQVWCEPVDRASDIWSLGVVAFEMLTGENPFEDAVLARVFERIVRHDVPLAHVLRPDLPAAIDDVFRQVFEREPSRRPSSAEAFMRALRHLVPADDARAHATTVVASPAGRGDLGADAASLPVADVEANPLVRDGSEKKARNTSPSSAAQSAPNKPRRIAAALALALTLVALAVTVSFLRSRPARVDLPPEVETSGTPTTTTAPAVASVAAVAPTTPIDPTPLEPSTSRPTPTRDPGVVTARAPSTPRITVPSSTASAETSVLNERFGIPVSPSP